MKNFEFNKMKYTGPNMFMMHNVFSNKVDMLCFLLTYWLSVALIRISCIIYFSRFLFTQSVELIQNILTLIKPFIQLIALNTKNDN